MSAAGRTGEAKIAIGVVESYLASADSKAAYWAVELDLRLGMPEETQPGDIAKRFLVVVAEKFPSAVDDGQ